MNCEHIPFSDYRYSKSLRSYEFTDFAYVELAKHRKKGAPKILFVLDYTPRESLRHAMLLKGPTGELLENIATVAEDVFGAPSLNDRDWLAMSYHCVKTQGASDSFKEEAHREFKRRLEHVIAAYKPEVVVTFGPDPYRALNAEFLSKYKGKDGEQYQHFYGVPIDTTITHKEEKHSFKHVPTLSLHTLLNDSKGDTLALIGYCGRNMTTALNRGKLMYEIPKLKYTIEVVDDLDKFNAMYKDICNAKVVAIDTETKNLYKRQNQTLTWQFSTRPDHAYILPFLHKDSPFLPEEIAYIKKKLRLYFERTNKNKVQIYANAAFDLNGARRDLGVRYFKADVWDVFAGDFCFHPDTLIVTEAGKIRIEDFIALEDKPKVLSYNHGTNRTEFKSVCATSEHETDEDMYELEYDGGTLRVTGNHKIWSVTRNAYIRVDEICEGEEVLVLA